MIAGLTLVVASVGLYLGFIAGRPGPSGKSIPKVPDQGAILYDMHSVVSPPDRIRLEWREVPDAASYRVTILSVEDESLFVSPVLKTNAWVIPPETRRILRPGTAYHWLVAVMRRGGLTERSDVAAFATQESLP